MSRRLLTAFTALAMTAFRYGFAGTQFRRISEAHYGDDFVLWIDNDSAHTSARSEAYYTANNTTVIFSPGQSLETNPIKSCVKKRRHWAQTHTHRDFV
ncbi:hypothetical protein F4802DRAFT_491603 [Xylaria palmicola]|nr:hypothetical protein F4802DRAFT_491603 [Xylaria palmicola]